MNKNDFNQISQLLDDKLESKLNEKLEPIHKELTEHGKILNEHSKILKSHDKSLKSLTRNQNTMLKLLDSEQMQQRKRLKKIEEHLDINSGVN